MKRKGMGLLAACILTVGMAACGKDSVQETNTGQQDEIITTTFWTDTQALEESFTAAAEAFMEEYPQYQIQVEAFAGSERAEKLSLAKQGGTLPSIFFTAYFTSADEVHQGTILSVDEIVNTYYREDIDASILEQVKVGDNCYMVPIYTSSQGMLYNADIFKEAGLEAYISEKDSDIICWSLDDLENVILPALKEYFAGTEKYPMALYAGDEQNDSYTIGLLRMMGGEIIADGTCKAGADANTVKALEKLGSWVEAGYTNSDVVTRVATDCNADFQKQFCAISSGQFTTYNNIKKAFADGSAEPFDIRVAVTPRKTADGQDSGSMHTYVYGMAVMNTDEKQQKLAEDFLVWLSGQKEYQKNMAISLPASSTVIEELAGENPIYTSYSNLGEYAFDFTGQAPGYVSTRAFLYPALQSFFGGNGAADMVLKDYMENANAVIEDYSTRSVVLNK